jgi:Na+-transporting methylmalonyl-CoA/oxaloacetate decarboxylase gamma subunit
LVLSFVEGDQYMTFSPLPNTRCLYTNLQDVSHPSAFGHGNSVCVFYVLLVFLTKGIPRSSEKSPRKEQPAATSPVVESVAPSGGNDAEIAAAIAAAFVQSKKK